MRLGEFQKKVGRLDRESDVKGWSKGNLGGALRSKKQTEGKCCLLFVECSNTQNINDYGRTEKELKKRGGGGNKMMSSGISTNPSFSGLNEEQK